MFAIIAGVLFGLGDVIAGVVLTLVAIACLWAWRNRDDNERGLY